jgi:Protein DA1
MESAHRAFHSTALNSRLQGLIPLSRRRVKPLSPCADVSLMNVRTSNRGGSPRSWPWLGIGLLALWLGSPLRAEAESCAVCGQPLTGEFYWFQSPALESKQSLCKACSQLPNHCAVCKIPLKSRFRKLEDGRLLCERHGREAILDERVALRTFEDMKRVLFPILNGHGALPDRNITVRLVDARAMAILYQGKAAPTDNAETLGLTRSTRRGNQFDHKIYLMNGLGPARLTAIAAHEYTHAWLQENLPPDRRIDRNTEEGFCELVAFQVMAKQGNEVEKKVILHNAYTKGQIQALLNAEDQFRFYRVVTWMKAGAGDRLSPEALNQVLDLKDSAPPSATWALPVVKTRVPDTLVLKGISGKAPRRFALINDQTFAQNEEAKVRVGNATLLVRCLAIRDRSVLVQVKDRPGSLELKLNAAP